MRKGQLALSHAAYWIRRQALVDACAELHRCWEWSATPIVADMIMELDRKWSGRNEDQSQKGEQGNE